MGDVFQFWSSASLEKLTGQRANNLEELLELIKTCPDSSIFYHTFSAFRHMREVEVPFNSDFAIWVSRCLNEKALAERLMAIDLAEYNTVKSLRSRLIEIIEGHREEKHADFLAEADEPFYLYNMVRIVYMTDKFAYDLKSFRDALSIISVDSIYFHFIESRLYSQLQTDDFSRWLKESLNEPGLARLVRNIDISVYSLEGLRSRMVDLIDEYTRKTKPRQARTGRTKSGRS